MSAISWVEVFTDCINSEHFEEDCHLMPPWHLPNCFVASWLDYCTSLLVEQPTSQFGCSEYLMQQPNSSTMRPSTHTPCFCCDKLHWLRYLQCYENKLCVIVYKALHEMAPAYINELYIPAIPAAVSEWSYTLWSSKRCKLCIPWKRLNLMKGILVMLGHVRGTIYHRISRIYNQLTFFSTG